MRFPAADIHTDGMAVDIELSSEWLEHQLQSVSSPPVVGASSSSGRVVGRLSRSGHDILVRARVEALLALPCVRCLEPAAVTVDADLSLMLQAASRSDLRKRHGDSGGEYAFTSKEAELDVYDGETVVLDGYVREALLLELPSFPLCRDSCPGIALGAMAAGAFEPDDNRIDPRLAPLGAFRSPSGSATLDDLVQAAADRSRALGRKPVLQANRGGRSKRRNKR